mmetsp:Transcript_10702/g.24392  ORF Transcript_10702/g.24392 Transcript_10702/m.24392 type:complete len:238 (-) Transcript_10702:237-950(-)
MASTQSVTCNANGTVTPWIEACKPAVWNGVGDGVSDTSTECGSAWSASPLHRRDPYSRAASVAASAAPSPLGNGENGQLINLIGALLRWETAHSPTSHQQAYSPVRNVDRFQLQQDPTEPAYAPTPSGMSTTSGFGSLSVDMLTCFECVDLSDTPAPLAEGIAEDDELPQAEMAIASIGSVGHPLKCALPCKYFQKKSRGCKDGVSCTRCHLCGWRPADNRRRRAQAKGSKESPVEP